MKKSPLYAILAVSFTNILGAGMVLPILPLYAVEALGATEFQAALLTTAYFIAQFIAAPIMGQLSDRVGRRPVLLVSQVGTFFSFVLFYFAEEIGALLDTGGVSVGMTGGLLMMFIARSLDGITGGNITAAQAYISDIATPEKRTQTLGMLSAAMGTGFIFGPALGGLFAGMGIKMPFVAAAVITLVTLAITFFVLQESLPPEKRIQKVQADTKTAPEFSFKDTLSDRKLLLLILLGFLLFSAFSALPPIFALYVDQVILTDISSAAEVAQRVAIVFMASSIFMVTTQIFFLRPLLKRLGERRLVLLGFSIWALGMFIFPYLDELWMIAVGMFPYAFSRGIIDPSLQSLVTRFSSEKTRGRVLGIYQSAQSMAMIFGPIWAGWMFTNISPGSVFVGAGAILSVGVLFALVLQRVNVEEKAVV